MTPEQLSTLRRIIEPGQMAMLDATREAIAAVLARLAELEAENPYLSAVADGHIIGWARMEEREKHGHCGRCGSVLRAASGTLTERKT